MVLPSTRIEDIVERVSQEVPTQDEREHDHNWREQLLRVIPQHADESAALECHIRDHAANAGVRRLDSDADEAEYDFRACYSAQA